MHTIQLNKLAMYRAVHALLANAAETNAIAALPSTHLAFAAKLDEIETLAAVQSQPLGATIAQRNQAFEELVDATLALAGIALSYADQKRIDPLAVMVRLTAGDFKRARIDLRVRMAQQVHDAIAPFVAQLAEFGVTAASLQELQTKVDAAAAVLPSARATTVDKKAATAQLAATIRAVDSMLEKQVDPLLLPLRKMNPRFYERYQVARKVVGRPGLRASAVVTEPGNTEPASVVSAVIAPAEKLAA